MLRYPGINGRRSALWGLNVCFRRNRTFTRKRSMTEMRDKAADAPLAPDIPVTTNPVEEGFVDVKVGTRQGR